MHKRIMIVGAGFSGAVLARELADKGYHIDIIDKRDHLAGNAYDYMDEESGIRIHKYGAHLFHTNNKKIFEYLSRYTEWVPYKHKVKAMLEDGTLVTLPVNRETVKIIGGDEYIKDIFFRPYSEKMWGIKLEELDLSVTNRVPVRNDLNEYYFPDDLYQGIPKHGYTQLIKNILNHKNIKISLSTEFDKNYEKDYERVFNSMPIDQYYDYIHGYLPYRSIKFEHVRIPARKIFPVATVNFTHTGPQTRVHEWKNIPEHCIHPIEQTILTFETPCCYTDNNEERYYPVKDVSGINNKIYNNYKKIKNDKVKFIGRCGQYVYIDMHQAVNMSLQLAKKY